MASGRLPQFPRRTLQGGLEVLEAFEMGRTAVSESEKVPQTLVLSNVQSAKTKGVERPSVWMRVLGEGEA